MRHKKILLIAPYNHYATGLRQLAAVLLAHGYQADILVFKKYATSRNSDISEVEWDLLHSYIASYKPDCIGVSFTSTCMLEKQVCCALKKSAPEAVIVCGGIGPTFESARYLHNGADYVVRGEGEGAILDVAEALHTGADMRSIRNVAYLEDGELVENPLRPLIEDLDSLPYYLHGGEHFACIENDEIIFHDPVLTDEKTYLTSTSRGCVGRCTYCCGSNWLVIYRQECGRAPRYRSRDVEAILVELEQAKAKGATSILFYDEYFIRPPEDFHFFMTQYRQRINLPYFLMVHTGFLAKDERRFQDFWKSGVYSVQIGVQSASKRISGEIFRRAITAEHQLESIRKFHEYRIVSAVDFIVAHALEEEKDYRETLDFIKKLPFDPTWPVRTYINVFVLGLLPGAPIGDLYPVLREKPVSEKVALHRMLMPYLRHIIKDDAVFESLYVNPVFQERPEELMVIYKREFYAALHDALRHAALRLAGKEVWFWGCGQIYRAHKHLFRECKPRGMLLNVPTELTVVDGLEILHPDEALQARDNTPIIIFGGSAGILSNMILREYPGYTDIITVMGSGPVLPIFL